MFIKKLSVFVLALLLVGAAYIMATGSQAGKEKEVEVTFWAFPLGSTDEESLAMYDPAVEELAKSHSYIKVNIELFPWDGRREKMLTALVAGTNPDVAYLNEDMKPLFEGNLLDLNDYLTKEDLKDFVPKTIEGASYKGFLAYLPVLTNNSAMFYNIKLLEKAGYSREWANSFHTWDDFLEACEKIKGAGIWPYLGHVMEFSSDHLSPWLYQAGGDYFNEDVTRSTLGSPEAIEAVKFMASLWDNYIDPTYKDAPGDVIGDAFAQGKAAMFMGQNHAIKNWLNDYPDLDLVYGYPLEKKKMASPGTIAGYGVFSPTKHPEEAVELVKALTSYPAMLYFCTKLAFIPPRHSAMEKMVSESDDPVFQRAAENLEWYYPTVAASPIGPGNKEALRLAFQKILLTGVPAEEAMKECQENVTKLLDDYYKKKSK